MKRSDDDAFGQSLWDCHTNGSSVHVIERDDGHVEPFDAAVYFTGVREWSPNERSAAKLVRGPRVLDIGCGAGRHAIELQRRGFNVLGIDASPLAVKTASARGLKRAMVLRIERLSPRLGTFDTVIMFGNNFGLFGNATKANRLLKRLRRITAAEARILAGSNDIYQTDNRVHLDYQKRNRARSRMSGQVRIRVRYKNLATSYMDYLMVSPDEMRDIVADTGWQIDRLLKSPASASYVAVLGKLRSHAV